MVLILRLVLGSTAVLPVPGREWSMKRREFDISAVTREDSKVGQEEMTKWAAGLNTGGQDALRTEATRSG